MKISATIKAIALVGAFAAAITSCSDGKTYAELLQDENMYCNNFLADQRVINEVPADSVFEYGENAPFYRLDPDGQLYMQVIDPGTPGNRVDDDELIYFRFTRYNLSYYKNGELPTGEGNENNLSFGSTSFRYGNYSYQFSAQWGQGIQMPLSYLPVDCRVRIVIKSQYGLTSEIAYVIPYLYSVSYYRPKI